MLESAIHITDYQTYSAFNNSVNLLSLKYPTTLTSNQCRAFNIIGVGSGGPEGALPPPPNILVGEAEYIKPYAEDSISIWPTVTEIFKRKWVHKISKIQCKCHCLFFSCFRTKVECVTQWLVTRLEWTVYGGYENQIMTLVQRFPFNKFLLNPFLQIV